MISDIHGIEILDLACGTGSIVQYLADDVSYTGLDLAEKMIFLAKKRIKQTHISKYRFIVESAHNMPFYDQEFDVVICNLALHFFPDYRQVISEVGRVLKKDGSFIACLPVKGRNKYYDIIWQRLSRRSFRWGIPLYERDIKESCEVSGFSYKHIASNGSIIYFEARKQ
jgi:ubiquinone/menaquinone biosynthesis C-methylase UbiE